MKKPGTVEPFLIVTKTALQAIVDGIDGRDAAFSVSVFVALRWLANDAGSDQVESTIAQIAFRAGVCYNTAAKVLPMLERLGVVAVARKRIPGTVARAPSVYTFPLAGGTFSSMRGRSTSPRGRSAAARQTSPTPRETSPTPRETFPTAAPPSRAERIKESKDRKEDRSGRAPRGASELHDSSFLALAKAEGSCPEELTSRGRASIEVALAVIMRVRPNVSAAEIERRARVYRSVMPSGTRLTARALATHWARCGGGASSPAASAAQRVTDPEPINRRERCLVFSRMAEPPLGITPETWASYGDRPWAELTPSVRKLLLKPLAATEAA